MYGDYIPRPDAEFNNWFKNLCQYVTVKTSVIPPATTPEWTHIPAAEVTLLNNSYTSWYTAYVIVLKPHTPADTLACPKAFGFWAWSLLGKPADVHGIEVRWAFLDKAPVDIKTELTQSSFDTKSPLILNFEEYDRGKRIYLAGRWEISREGIKGEFGDIVSAIVP
jgi:hypothetical protein